jgi:hypothetical protein
VRKTKHTHEDYEEFGQWLDRAHDTLRELHCKVHRMWTLWDPDGRPSPSAYEKQVQEIGRSLADLQSKIALEFHSETHEAEIAPGKPRAPSPFGRGRP